MYEKGDSYILDMMLKAESFSDFLNRADFMDLIMAYDRQQWKDFMENRKYIELCVRKNWKEKAILDEAKAGVEQEQTNMEALIDQKNRDITAYESDITNKEQAIKEYKQSIVDQDVGDCSPGGCHCRREKKILEASGTVLTYDGGTFKFPLATYTRISMITATVSIRHWESNSSTTAWISRRPKARLFMRPMTDRWWQPLTATPWATT